MTIFEDLNEKYASWRKRNSDSYMASARFAHEFAEGLATYIGASGTYPEMSNQNKTRKWVEVRKLVDVGGGTYTYEDCDNFYDMITQRDDGFWRYGIAVTLEQQKNAYPKGEFLFPIYFTVEDDACNLQVGEGQGEFDIIVTDKSTYEQAYKFIVAELARILESKPGDNIREKQKIGFILHSA